MNSHHTAPVHVSKQNKLQQKKKRRKKKKHIEEAGLDE